MKSKPTTHRRARAAVSSNRVVSRFSASRLVMAADFAREAMYAVTGLNDKEFGLRKGTFERIRRKLASAGGELMLLEILLGARENDSANTGDNPQAAGNEHRKQER